MDTGRRLVLVRHAKAEQFAAQDHSRELTARGRRDAQADGEWLRASDIQPDLALVSSATRTRQTWDAITAALSGDVPVEHDRALYNAGPEEVFSVIRLVEAEVATLVVVGHNPSISHLASVLDDGSGDPEAFATASSGLPTAAVAVLEVPVSWADLAEGTASLRTVHVP